MRRIDVHAHLPMGALGLPGPGPNPGAQGPPWDPAAAIAYLDRRDIQTQVLSLPHLFVSAPDRRGGAAGLARQVNERFSALVVGHPNRFGAYATVPLDSAAGAVEELTHALDALHLDGVALTSNSHGRYLGDPVFEPVLAEAERRGVPVFLHPTSSQHADELALGRPNWLVEFPLDTARSVIDAIYAGVFERHPHLRVIVAHCGGALPALAWRITHLVEIGRGDADADVAPESVDRALRNLHYDTALSGAPGVIGAVLQITDTSHLLYGTDIGAASEDVVARNTQELGECGLTAQELAGVERANAACLFARLGG